jgi:diacylglycerol kinase (ATP)
MKTDLKKSKNFSVAARFHSMKYAISGISTMLKSEHNAWIHVTATLCTVALAFILDVNKYEWCFLILAIMTVWVAEALNTALEFLCDLVSPDFHPLIKKSKDIAAGAVLLSAIGAVAIALVIFIPRLSGMPEWLWLF